MKCLHCNENIDDKQEYFFVGHWDEGKGRSKVVHFHASCFRSMAGNKFSNLVKNKNNTNEVYLDSAHGSVLDKIGKMVGIKRGNIENDEKLRKRIRLYMTI